MGALGGLKVDTREIVLPLIIGKQNEHSTQRLLFALSMES
jgi:hypothetical protein